MTVRNPGARAAELEAEATRLRTKMGEDAALAAAKVQQQAEIETNVLAPAAERYRARLDAVEVTVRGWFPGGETLETEVIAARDALAAALAEVGDAGISLRSRYNADRMLARHSVARLLPLLKALAVDGPQANEDGVRDANDSGDGPEAV